MNTDSNHAKAASLGGQAVAAIQRQKALEAKHTYNEDPNRCQACGAALLASLDPNERLYQTQRKKYCNHSCACTHNNNRRGTGKPKPLRLPKAEKFAEISLRTKGEHFARYKNWQTARSILRQHAVWVYENSGRPRVCVHCLYEKYVEIAHRKAVKDFPTEALIRDINALDNLMPLCPNHHWEHDHLIEIEE